MSNNQFSGDLDLTRLPSRLHRLSLEHNCFSGTVILSQLPQVLEELDLSGNELSGEVFISHLLFDTVNAENTKIIKRPME